MHATLCDFVLDIVQNAHEAGASRIELDFYQTERALSVRVADNGSGMTEEEQMRALDPFYSDGRKHARRRVGLGLPFLVHALEMVEGRWSMQSEKGRGTSVAFAFPLEHIDCPPMGSVVSLFVAAFCMDGDYELVLYRKREGLGLSAGRPELEYRLMRSELAEAAGGLNEAQAIVLARDFLESQESG